MIEKSFDPDLLYNKIVHYYVDKKNFSKEQANAIAQNIINREIERRKCKNSTFSLKSGMVSFSPPRA